MDYRSITSSISSFGFIGILPANLEISQFQELGVTCGFILIPSTSSFFFFFFLICVMLHPSIYSFNLFMAVLGLRLRARAFSSCGKRGPLFIAVRRPLTTAASLVAEHRLQTRRLSNRGPRAQPLRGMWDPPRPGLEPVSPASAGRLPTTAPPGKPTSSFKSKNFLTVCSGTVTNRHP